ncbi:MAG TPA: alpha-D-ribose 1-methylphosphonate 5-phosphate C-P-lyase PhnJ [Bryobacteraceae bacterium]|nr:alpha-D-ribose 1-methylphosphonate 5-phosphate C-P-lyase PhnJ [Bryobacteraceae bacterium]
MVENAKFQSSYSYGFIDETTKKEIRRKMLKAICIPGYQVPYSSPEMPISRGWGTGGLHLTLSLMGRNDVFKIIDQGSDASVNACNLRQFVQMMTECAVTYDTAQATIIQSRHRVPEEVLTDQQILVLQVPQPEVLRGVERYEFRTRQMHAEADYARMWVSLYESYVRFGALMRGAGYPIKVNSRYIATPSPIPRWDTPNLSMANCLYLFGAGREKRIHAIPPHTRVEPLEFEDVRFKVEEFRGILCSASGQDKAFMDEIFDDADRRKHVINDSNFLDKVKTGPRPPQRLFTNPE